MIGAIPDDRCRFDLIIVGGGIAAVSLLHEASRRGLRAALVERRDFGQGATGNSLRLLHGGMRYLGQFDLTRCRRSALEQQWFRKTFPEYVRVLPCVMPLARFGLQSAPFLRAATWMHSLIARDSDLAAEYYVGRCRNISANFGDETMGLDLSSNRQVAVWPELVITNPARVLMELIGRAVDRGSVALNYTKATSLICQGDQVRGVTVVDSETADQRELFAHCVVNATGADCHHVFAGVTDEVPELRPQVMAVNVVLKRCPQLDRIQAVRSCESRSRWLFLVPRQSYCVAGTWYFAGEGADSSGPGAEQIGEIIDELRKIWPDLELSSHSIRTVEWGWLPTDGANQFLPRTRPIVIDHGAQGGPRGFVTYRPEKLTTARASAERVIERLFSKRTRSATVEPWSMNQDVNWESIPLDSTSQENVAHPLQKICAREAVRHLDDVILRRTDWVFGTGISLARLAEHVAGWTGWTTGRTEQELRRWHQLVIAPLQAIGIDVVSNQHSEPTRRVEFHQARADT